MKFPYNTEDGKSAPAPDKGAPASIDQVLSKRPLQIGGPEDLTDKERKLIYRNMPKEPVEGEEAGEKRIKCDIVVTDALGGVKINGSFVAALP